MRGEGGGRLVIFYLKCAAYKSTYLLTPLDPLLTPVYSLSIKTVIFQWISVSRYQNVSILDSVGAQDDGGGEW